MGLYAWHVLEPRIGSQAVMAYDLYFGYVVRFVVYCFCGMGLLWMQSTYVVKKERKILKKKKTDVKSTKKK
jgi:hypothetical protein